MREYWPLLGDSTRELGKMLLYKRDSPPEPKAVSTPNCARGLTTAYSFYYRAEGRTNSPLILFAGWKRCVVPLELLADTRRFASGFSFLRAQQLGIKAGISAARPLP